MIAVFVRSASPLRPIRIRVSKASTGVIQSDSPYQSRGVFESGRRLSWPQAYCLYPCQACRNSSRTLAAVAGSRVRICVEFPGGFLVFCAAVPFAEINATSIKAARSTKLHEATLRNIRVTSCGWARVFSWINCFTYKTWSRKQEVARFVLQIGTEK